MNDSQSELEIGSRDGYDWLVSTETLSDLLRLCPDTVIGKYVAVTSFDSGPLVLNDEEKAIGWQAVHGVAYSPKVERIEMLPRDVYDEWYVFANPVNLGELVRGRNIFECQMKTGEVYVFVNFGGFALHRPNYADLGQLFWEQLGWIKPESYIADGECLNFVTSQKGLFARACHELSREP